MKTLGNLTPNDGSNRPKKRLGRGLGSKWGKTAGKGHGGQKSRKSGGVAPGFEGGQNPLYRRLPKRGFKNHFRVEYCAVNLDALNRFEDGTKVTPELLDKAGLIKNKNSRVKLLGRGELGKKLTIVVHRASGSAKTGLEKAGSTLEVIFEKPAPVKTKRK